MDPVTALLALGLYLFGPRPKLFQPKPDMKAVAAAQAQVETAKAEQAKAEATLEQMRALVAAKDAEERSKQREILSYGQETNQMASDALNQVPVEHRTAEVELAAEMVGRTGVAFASAIGQLRSDQREALLGMVQRLLSRQAEERKQAREELALKDKQLVESIRERALIQKDLEHIKTEEAKQKAEVMLTKAEVLAKDSELKQANEKALSIMGKLNSETSFFWKVILWIVGLWLWFTRVLPALASIFPAFAWLNRFNKFVFHLLTGASTQ